MKFVETISNNKKNIKCFYPDKGMPKEGDRIWD